MQKKSVYGLGIGVSGRLGSFFLPGPIYVVRLKSFQGIFSPFLREPAKYPSKKSIEILVVVCGVYGGWCLRLEGTGLEF